MDPCRNCYISTQSIVNVTIVVVLVAISISITIRFDQYDSKFKELQADADESKTVPAQQKTPQQGTPGIPGRTGVKGLEGEAGRSGKQGPQGLKGEMGITGFIGVAGAVGDTGDMGATGLPGAPSGIKGYTGARGSQGIDGMSGFPGRPGITSNLGNNSFLESCDALKKAGVIFSGVYSIDPDGPESGLDPFPVICDMASDLNLGYTIVRHDQEEDGHVNNHEAVALFRINISYDLEMAQINALKNVSTSCRQFIKYACFGSLIHDTNGDHYTYWMSVNGEKMINWGGVPTDTKGCACSLTRTCDDTTKLCNCDVNDSVPRVDEGYLTDKAELPVSELRFGDTGSKSERGIYTLGPLQCA